MLIDSGKFSIHISVPLVLEYEDVAKRLLEDIPLTEQEIDDILKSLEYWKIWNTGMMGWK